MARVVYGVSGEGSGHSSRARVVLRHLLDAGHEVKVASYDRGYRNLAGDFDVLEIEGLSIGTSENRVSRVRTFTENLRRLPQGWRKLRELKARLFDEFAPHCVLTDFEPMTAHLAGHADLPLVTVDNQHRMRSMEHPCPRYLRRERRVVLAVIRAMIPHPDVSLVTTFFYGTVKDQRTFLFPPILRPEVRALEPREGDHVLVYFTKGFETFLPRLREHPGQRFLVYGADPSDAPPPRASVDNLAFRPFSRDGFLADLASARAVIASAGFTLMTECLHLRKPMLALPMRGQFEQELNALLLADLGYGKRARRTTGETVGDFLWRLPQYRERLEEYADRDERALFAKLDELLADDAARALEYHRRRLAS